MATYRVVILGVLKAWTSGRQKITFTNYDSEFVSLSVSLFPNCSKMATPKELKKRGDEFN